MRWKIYAWVFIVLCVFSIYTLATKTVDPPLNLLLVCIDCALSFVAAVGIFLFAFGKKSTNTILWKILAIIFISYDLICNILTVPTERNGVIVDTIVITIGFALIVPAYIAIVLYSQGKVNTHKKVASKPAKKEVIYFQKDPKKVALLSFLTLGIYNVYWFYKHWRAVKVSTGINTHPIFSTIFSIFTIYFLFKRITNSAKKHGYNTKFNACLFTFIFLIPSLIFASMIWFCPITREFVIIEQLLLATTIMSTYFVINNIQRAANFSNEKVLGKKIPKTEMSTMERILAVFGVLILISYTLLISNKIINNKFPVGTDRQIQSQSKIAEDLDNEYDTCSKKLNIEIKTLDSTNQATVDAYNAKYDKCEDIRIRQNKAADEYNRLAGY